MFVTRRRGPTITSGNQSQGKDDRVIVGIVGHLGNMGTRYCRIVEHLGHEWIGADVGSDPRTLAFTADALIVASPTAYHVDHIRALKDYSLPILCEKPVTKDLDELEELLADLKKAGTRLKVVNQYAELSFPKDGKGLTAYDYFKTGGDGLYWDCISLIGLANGAVELRNKSPIWHAQINGEPLSISDMDAAYVRMVSRWLRDPTATDYDAIHRTHKRVYDLCRPKS